MGLLHQRAEGAFRGDAGDGGDGCGHALFAQLPLEFLGALVVGGCEEEGGGDAPGEMPRAQAGGAGEIGRAGEAVLGGQFAQRVASQAVERVAELAVGETQQEVVDVA